jgi:hypothetical protein
MMAGTEKSNAGHHIRDHLSRSRGKRQTQIDKSRRSKTHKRVCPQTSRTLAPLPFCTNASP